MKFYIAGRTARINDIKKMVSILEERGHTCTHDWTAMEDAELERPYDDHVEKVQNFAEKDISGARDADVFIILGDKSGTGMYVEMGAALSGGAKVYAIGEYNNLTVFHYHPRVTRLETFEEVLLDLGC